MSVSGCGWCGKSSEVTTALSSETTEVIKTFISSLIFSSSGRRSNKNKKTASEVFGGLTRFCSECELLLTEVKRLKVLVDLVTSHLNELLDKVKLKYEDGRSRSSSSLRVKVEQEVNNYYDEPEVNLHNDNDVDSDDEFMIEPVHIKEEYDVPYSLSDSDSNAGELANVSSKSSEEDDADFIPTRSNRKRRLCISKSNSKNASSSPGNLRKKNSKQLISSNNNFFSCTSCQTTFNSKEEKFLHEETVHLQGTSDDVEGSTLLYSRICGKASFTPRELTTHNESFHSSHLNFVCLNCTATEERRKFYSPELLKAHQAIHSTTPGNPLNCSLCPVKNKQSYSSPDHLDNHLRRVHFHLTKANVFILKRNKVCEQCEDSPETKQKLLELKQEANKCRFCHSKEKCLYEVRQHERSAHPEKFVHLCSHCGESFVEANELLTCQESHRTSSPCFNGQYKCFVCKGRYNDGPSLRVHLEAKHTSGLLRHTTECQGLKEIKEFRSTTSTFKLSHEGYIYNRRNGYKGATYWYCDQKSICKASLIERNGKFSIGRGSAWNEDGTHKAHKGDNERCETQTKIGEAREAMLQNPTLTASEIIKSTVGQLLLPSAEGADGGENNVGASQKYSTLKRSLYRYRKSVRRSEEYKKKSAVNQDMPS